jgi:beta-lactamase superfamily II metal-dependent hydrolase
MSRVIVFDVEHGFCAFVKSPTGQTLMIDCGRKEQFSPVVYVIDNELNGARLTQLIVTHPHDDHIEDIQYVTSKLPPLILQRQVYDWEEVRETESDYENLDHYSGWQAKYSAPAPAVDWGMDIKVFYLTPAVAQALNQDNWVNNSGMVVVVTITGTKFSEKFVFGADVETDGFTELLKNKDFKAAVAGADFYIASHHGHSSGFSTELYDAMGKPFLNLISATSGDEHVDSCYGSEDYARGVEIDGERRYSLTTRTDGSIFIDVNDEGKFSVYCVSLDDNEEEDALTAAVKAFLAGRR